MEVGCVLIFERRSFPTFVAVPLWVAKEVLRKFLGKLEKCAQMTARRWAGIRMTFRVQVPGPPLCTVGVAAETKENDAIHFTEIISS
jgi:hypothetical protein